MNEPAPEWRRLVPFPFSQVNILMPSGRRPTRYGLFLTIAGAAMATLGCGSDGQSIGVPGPTYSLRVVTQPVGSTGGMPLTTQPAFEVVDDDGVRATSTVFEVSVRLTGGTAGASLRGVQTIRTSAGLATFSTLMVDFAGTGYQLTAFAAAASDAQTESFDVAVGPVNPVTSTIMVSTELLLPGDSAIITVEARDLGRNLIGHGGDALALTLGSGGADLTLGPVTDLGTGTYTATAYANGVGSGREVQLQFGSGTLTSSGKTLRIAGFVGVSISDFHGCGWLDSGEAYCWGRDLFGELGTGQTINHPPRPVKVKGDFSWKYVGAGADMTCGLEQSGKVYCWGSNQSFALGVEAVAPAQLAAVESNRTFLRLAVGWDLGACGITSAQETLCWGTNRFSQTGVAQPVDGALPTVLSAPVSFESTGRDLFGSCGISAAGVPYCWGSNLNGLLGVADSTLTNQCLNTRCSSTPMPISSPVPLVPSSLSVGQGHGCGLTAAGDAYCWGNGGINNGQASPAIPVASGMQFTQLVVAGNHYCGIATDQKTYCWGDNNYGQTGTGTAGSKLATPTPVSGDLRFTQLDSGPTDVCGVTLNGRLYCWGNNIEGQLGDGSTTDRWVPTLVRSFN